MTQKVRSQKANFLLIAFFVSVIYFLTNFTNHKSEDSMALWGGRFTQAADKRFKNFNDSLRFDYRLAEQDIEGSIGWSKALVSVNIDIDTALLIQNKDTPKICLCSAICQSVIRRKSTRISIFLNIVATGFSADIAVIVT